MHFVPCQFFEEARLAICKGCQFLFFNWSGYRFVFIKLQVIKGKCMYCTKFCMQNSLNFFCFLLEMKCLDRDADCSTGCLVIFLNFEFLTLFWWSGIFLGVQFQKISWFRPTHVSNTQQSFYFQKITWTYKSMFFLKICRHLIKQQVKKQRPTKL